MNGPMRQGEFSTPFFSMPLCEAAWEASKRSRVCASIDPEVNAIICSGYSDAAAIAEFLSFGFRGALPKPFTRRELADALQKALEGAAVN